MSIPGFKPAFYGAIATVLRFVDSQRWQRKVFTQLLAQFFAQVGHISKAVRLFGPQPFPNLLGSELLESLAGDPIGEFVFAEMADILHPAKIGRRLCKACEGLCAGKMPCTSKVPGFRMHQQTYF
jgi:hypothetical protein